MKSEFQFLSYKVNSVDFKVHKSFNLLNSLQNLNPEKFNINLKFAEPNFFKKAGLYIGGLKLKFEYHDVDIIKIDSPLIYCEIEISGLFRGSEGRLESSAEENLVKYQIPTLLLPYVRSTITSLFANAGFGTFIFPLINVQAVAKSLGPELKIKTIE